MFMGEYQHGLDDKNRLIMPARFREELGLRFIVTKGLDACLFVYPLSQWEKLQQELGSLSFTKADSRAFVRLFFSGASECELDKQGRIVIPGNLKEYAHLDKDCVVLGVSNRVEIWGKDVWAKYSTDAEGSYEEIAEKLEGLGI